jgi:hypothetical protein
MKEGRREARITSTFGGVGGKKETLKNLAKLFKSREKK